MKCRLLSWNEGLRRKHGGWGLIAVSSDVVSGSLPCVQVLRYYGLGAGSNVAGRCWDNKGMPSHKIEDCRLVKTPRPNLVISKFGKLIGSFILFIYVNHISMHDMNE